MIDTCIFRLHDLKKHKIIVKYLLSNKAKSKSWFITYLDYSKLLPVSKVEAEIIKYSDTGNHYLKGFRSQLRIKSSNYDFVYQVNVERDFIEFNFSLPKYLYGNNICQFVPSPKSRDFSFPLHKEVNYQWLKLYDRFLLAVQRVFKNEFSHLETENGFYLDWRLLELRRIDFCFNQVFNSKDDALSYLRSQKFLKKSYERQSSDVMRDWRTSMSFQGEGYYFKVYHKGSEYEKNDKPEHLKLNHQMNKEKSSLVTRDLLQFTEFERPKKMDHWATDDNLSRANMDKMGFSNAEIKDTLLDKNFRYNFFDTEYLQGFSDKILRYEISIRNNFMSSVYKTKVFKSKNKIYQRELKLYKELHAKSKSGTELINITSDEIAFYKLFKKNIQKVHNFFPFMVELDQDIWNDLPITRGNNTAWSINQPLTQSLFNELFKRFWGHVTRIQPKEAPSTIQLKEAIDAWNGKVQKNRNIFGDVKGNMDKPEYYKMTGKKISKNKILAISMALETYGSFDEMERLSVYNKRTLQRWKKEFNDLGYSNQAVTDHIPVPVKLDFESYYMELMINQEKVYNNFYAKFIG